MGVGGSNRRGGHRPKAAGSNGAASPASGNRLVFTIPSDYEAGRQVQQRILTDCEKAGFDGEDFFAIKLALEEAIVNAIKHGNRLDPGKQVHVEAKVKPGRFEIWIEDEGPGFDRSCVPDPTLTHNLEKCSGRGILLIESYMNGVRWDRGGRRLWMVKDNEGK